MSGEKGKKLKSVTAIAPGKINLSLFVISRRSDGYHEIHTALQAIDIFEKVTVSQTSGAGISIKLKHSGFDLEQIPLDETNTVSKAIFSFFDFIKSDLPCGILVEIEKNIPVGAGLAGGSADAAATIVALNELFSTEFMQGEMMEIASLVGADVPFCIAGGTMLGSGVGTILSPLPPLGECYIVLAKSDFSVSTKTAYEVMDSAWFKPQAVNQNVENALAQGSILKVAESLENHFELSLSDDCYKKVKLLIDLMKASGALGARMSGSGSTVYGIFDNKEDAEKCLTRIEMVEFCSWSGIARPFGGGAKII